MTVGLQVCSTVEEALDDILILYENPVIEIRTRKVA